MTYHLIVDPYEVNTTTPEFKNRKEDLCNRPPYHGISGSHHAAKAKFQRRQRKNALKILREEASSDPERLLQVVQDLIALLENEP